tara:strand:+ start:30 stop:509 length:480 start_codon:yes stop_codon:yes gene_type:complete
MEAMNMNWDAIATIAELVGAIAVVATLIYFSRQIRSLASDSYANSVTLVEESERELQRLYIDHAALIVKSNGDEPLTEEEKFVLRELYTSTQGSYFFAFIRARVYERDGENSIRTFVKVLRRYPAFMGLYHESEIRENTRPRAKTFVSLVDKELESSGT